MSISERADDLQWADSLLEQLGELDHLYQTAPVGLGLLDCELRYRRINKRLAELNGKPVSMHIGRTLREVLPELAPTLEPILHRVIETARPVLNIELHVDDPARDLLINYYPLMTAEGKVRAISGVVQDVTEIKRAEAALREAHDLLEQRVRERTRELREANVRLRDEIAERLKVAAALTKSEERFRRVLESAPDAIVLVRCDHTIVMVNAESERLFGYRREELVGQKLDVLIPDRLRSRHRGHFESYFMDPRPNTSEIALFGLRKDGREVPVEVRLSPLEAEEGLLVSGSFRDVTLRKEAEEESRRHRDELAHVARVATLGELTAALAHELNQPLSAILSNAQAALRFLDFESPDLSELRGALHDIADDDKRASEVIRRLRALLRKGVQDHRRLDVDELIHEVVSLARLDTLGKKISLRLELSDELPSVLGDRIQLQQVVLNLLLNAAEAMTRQTTGPRELLVRTSQIDPEIAEVAVRDTGVGIADANLERIFDAFFTTRDEGLGMGLSISRTIIEAHGGRLWATRNPDRGATFHFTLPIARA